MTRSVTLHLDAFEREALEDLTESGNHSASQVARAAVIYYLGDRESGRPAWRVPRFQRGTPVGVAREVDFDDETWEALCEEAARQGTDPVRLAGHAILYYLSDMDSGRLAGRLDDALADGDVAE